VPSTVTDISDVLSA